MKKTLFFLISLLLSVGMNAQQNQVVYHNGRVQFANPINSIDSLLYSADTEEMDTLYMLLPRTIVMHDTVYITIHDTVYDRPDTPQPSEPDEAL